MNKYFLSLMTILILFQTFRVYDEVFFKEEEKEKGYKILSESEEDLKINDVKEANLEEKIDIQSLVINGNLENGKKISHVHVRWISPLPKDLGEILIQFKNILIPEINLGQLLRLIRSEYLVDAKGLNLVRGRPIGATTIVETVNKTLG